MKLKIYICISILVIALVSATTAFTQPANQANANTAPSGQSPEQEKLTAEQVQQAKKFLEQLVDQPKQTTTGTNSTPQPKTMADVLDKGIDMFAGYVTSVSEMIQKIAPDVWRIMIKQQYAKAISGVILPGMLIILVLIYQRVAKKSFKFEAEDKMFQFDDDFFTARSWFVGILPMIAFLVVGIWFAISFSSAVLILINPEYYALKDLLSMILGRQPM